MNFNTCACPQLLSEAFQFPKEPIMLHAEKATPGNFLIAPERRQRATQETTIETGTTDFNFSFSPACRAAPHLVDNTPLF